MENIFVYTDGGARGNPGPAAYGVYIENDKGEELYSEGTRLGNTTNNVAEYTGILAAYKWLISNKDNFPPNTKVNFYMDSLLLYSQITRVYKIKNLALKELIFQIWEKENELNIPVSYNHIRREGNKKADLLVNQALDYKT